MKYKNKLLPILCFALCFCIVWGSTTTAHAIDGVVNVLNKAPEVGDEFYYDCSCSKTLYGAVYDYYVEACWEITDSNVKNCLYIDSSGVIRIYGIIAGQTTTAEMLSGVTTYTENTSTGSVTTSTNQSFINIKPVEYGGSYEATNYFRTNIPIFSNVDDALAYVYDEIDVNEALNYNKTFENGSWVRPFEDIEINDNDMPVPSLSNLSHNGFNISNRDENYAVDVYVVNGMRKPGEFVNGVTLNLSSYLYGNTLGWLTDTEEAYMQDSFDLIRDFGVDNESLLNESVKAFYTDYPNAKAFYPDANFLTKVYYPVWGEPFGINNFVYNDVTEVTAADIAKVDCYDIPLCFTQYKVRFYYYNENDGMHFGPWAVVTYCSNGDVKSSISYSNSDGSVIDTPIENGKQDDYGNISFDNNDVSEFIDLSDPNALFGNIRSIFNNIKATTGSYSVIFTTVFSFIPADIQGLIWLGIAVIVFIGVVKAF